MLMRWRCVALSTSKLYARLRLYASIIGRSARGAAHDAPPTSRYHAAIIGDAMPTRGSQAAGEAHGQSSASEASRITLGHARVRLTPAATRRIARRSPALGIDVMV